MTEVSPELVKHREAMGLARKADVERVAGKEKEARELYFLAFQLEKSVALSLLNPDSHEPTRSVIFRSAASLGMLAGEYREAEKLIAQGLAGNPPELIAAQLRTLFEDLNLRRHLSNEGVLVGWMPTQLSPQGQRSENWPKSGSEKRKSTFVVVAGNEQAENLKEILVDHLKGKAAIIPAEGAIGAISLANTLLMSEEYQGSRVVLVLDARDDARNVEHARILMGDDSKVFKLVSLDLRMIADGLQENHTKIDLPIDMVKQSFMTPIIDFIRSAEEAVH